jgi:multidrug resistance efflux pump
VYKNSTQAVSQLTLDQSRLSLATADAAVAVAVDQESQARVAYEQQADAAIATALADEKKARLAYESQIDGENTTVASLKAKLDASQYYLDNTTMYAPEDGRIVNLQVREGMIAGIVRYGAIATFIADADRYVLATFNQENLLWVKAGQPVEVAIDLYPGRIFQGKVKDIWRASGTGQLLPSGELPTFDRPGPDVPQGQYAVQIVMDDADQAMFPIGAEGAAAIYIEPGGAWAALRKIDIRGYTWFNWLYPLNV